MTHSINSDKEQKPKALDRGFLHCLANLYKTYGPLGWWPADTDWEMMAGAILTQNTAWTNVEMALTNLKEAAGASRFTAGWLLEQNPEEIKTWIRPSGFFNQKTPRLFALAHWFVSHGEDTQRLHSMPLDDLRSELLAIKGVGPETCDSIVLYAAQKPVFLIDAYTRRLLLRLGYEVPRGYESLRANLEKLVKDARPYEDSEVNLGTSSELCWLQEAHALIVEHCKNNCRKKPLCSNCSLFSCQARI